MMTSGRKGASDQAEGKRKERCQHLFFLVMAVALTVLVLAPATRGADPAGALRVLQQKSDDRCLLVWRGDPDDPWTWYQYGGFDPRTWEPVVPGNVPQPTKGSKQHPLDVVSMIYYGNAIEDEQSGTSEGPFPLTDEQARLIAAVPTVRALTFCDAGLKPSHFAALASLSELQALDVAQTRLTKEDLAVIGRMKELRVLRLGGLGEQTRIDDAGLAQLGALSKLVSLSLMDGNNDTLKVFAGLQFIRCMEIHANITDAGLAYLASLRSLRILRICAPVSGVGMKYLADVPLQELSLSSATTEGLKSVALCKSLRKLGVGVQVEFEGEGLNVLAGMPHLWWLGVGGQINNEDFRDPYKLASLRVLNLTGCSSINDGAAKYLAKMTSLEYLELNGTNISGAGLVQLHTLKNLRHLTLPKCDESQYADDGTKKLHAALPNCTINILSPPPWEREKGSGVFDLDRREKRH